MNSHETDAWIELRDAADLVGRSILKSKWSPSNRDERASSNYREVRTFLYKAIQSEEVRVLIGDGLRFHELQSVDKIDPTFDIAIDRGVVRLGRFAGETWECRINKIELTAFLQSRGSSVPNRAATNRAKKDQALVILTRMLTELPLNSMTKKMLRSELAKQGLDLSQGSFEGIYRLAKKSCNQPGWGKAGRRSEMSEAG